MSEKRRSPRQKSLLRGFVYFENNPSAIDCIIRDISETGARIRFQSPPPASSDLMELQIPTKGQKIKCRVRWTSDNEIGVSFDAEAATDTEGLAIEDRMRRLENEITALKNIIKRLHKNQNPITEVA